VTQRLSSEVGLMDIGKDSCGEFSWCSKGKSVVGRWVFVREGSVGRGRRVEWVRACCSAGAWNCALVLAAGGRGWGVRRSLVPVRGGPALSWLLDWDPGGPVVSRETNGPRDRITDLARPKPGKCKLGGGWFPLGYRQSVAKGVGEVGRCCAGVRIPGGSCYAPYGL